MKHQEEGGNNVWFGESGRQLDSQEALGESVLAGPRAVMEMLSLVSSK